MRTPFFRFVSIFVGLIAIGSYLEQNARADEFSSSSIRAGVSVGAAPLGGLALSADAGPILNPHMSLGLELYGIHSIGIRALVWENAKFMNGLNGGGKILIALGNVVTIEPGAEFGWNYRFSNRVDAGVGINLLIGKAIGGSLKLTCGYLIQ